MSQFRRGRNHQKFLRLAAHWRKANFGRKMAFVLGGLTVLSGAATFAVLSGSWPFPSNTPPYMVLLLLNLDLVLILTLAIIVARKFYRIWAERKSGQAGSRLHIRLMVLFGAVAVFPATLLAIFSGLFFNIGVDTWFGDRVKTALGDSVEIAQAYVKEHQKLLGGEVYGIATDMNKNWGLVNQSDETMKDFLRQQSLWRGLSELTLYNTNGSIISSYHIGLPKEFNLLPEEAIQKADSGQVAVLAPKGGDQVQAVAKIETYLETFYIYASRFIDPDVLMHISNAYGAVNEYKSLEGRKTVIVVTYALIFIVVALMLVMASIWVGLSLASRLAQPIITLIDAAEQVRDGDLTVRVPEIAGSDEVASLGRAFNRMTNQLHAQQDALLETNRELDERRRFTETVLDGVSAGVLGLTADGLVHLPNKSAAALLNKDINALYGESIYNLGDDFAHIFNTIKEKPHKNINREFTLHTDDGLQILRANMAAEMLNGQVLGYVLTFDDVTELQSAQRKAAWADVARRIAHEIKNPLTPIQLSAERLRRRYLSQITQDPETFSLCTDMIVRNVTDIGRMVDEFSAFARMPAPKMQYTDIITILNEAVFLQKNGADGVRIIWDPPAETDLYVMCDSAQIHQALTNIIKNALESVTERLKKSPDEEGRVHIRIVNDTRCALKIDTSCIGIEVVDNGVGLPEDKNRLTEPYITTRSKGTGLGLAIVKKIMEDHGGGLELRDADGSIAGKGGAIITLWLPTVATS